ncbi:GNAT family N-acetyltransferase [Cohnella sp. 56]|uniref:GNAT family N-acetyltransferase n=1 Tax=Cohnella sp. 56 TaxID=3113722 RepID=UPI0030E9C8B2
MPDMLVKLYELPDDRGELAALESQGIRIVRAMTADKGRLADFAGKHFPENWRSECECAFGRLPSYAFIAVRNKEIVGFALYDAVVRNFFGPTGVAPDCRGSGIGKALLLETLRAMRDEGYAYAVIGWVEEAIGFYAKTVGATVIPDSFPGAYKNLVALN